MCATSGHIVSLIHYVYSTLLVDWSVIASTVLVP